MEVAVGLAAGGYSAGAEAGLKLPRKSPLLSASDPRVRELGAWMTKARALLPANKIHGVDLSQGLKLSHLNTIKGNLFEKMVRAELGVLNAGKNGFTSLTTRKTAIADLPLDHGFGVTDIKNARYLILEFSKSRNRTP